MADNPQVRFYLGANSPSGFYSLYDQLIDPAQAEDYFLIKGGPGCGKSTLMRRVGRAMEEHGLGLSMLSELILVGRNDNVKKLPIVPAVSRVLAVAQKPDKTLTPAEKRLIALTKAVVREFRNEEFGQIE